MFLTSSKAYAGTYVWTTTDAQGNITAQSPAYSGGTYTVPGSQGPQTTKSYTVTNSGYGGASGGSAPPSCTGTVSTTFTWQLAAGKTMTTDPPPSAVVVTESCTASAGTNQPGSTGSCSTGMGKSGSVTYHPGGGNNSVTVTDVRYTTPAGGATVTLPSVTPSATASTVGATSSVYYTASISPVTINLAGATPDSSGNLNILVGQGCPASLSNTIPSALLNNTTNPPTYSWTVSDSNNTFQSWNGNSGRLPVASVPGSGPLTNPTAHWYWNDLTQTPETVSCTVTLTPPTGQGSTFTVKPTQKVTVMVPTLTAYGTGTYMQVNTKAPHDTEYELWGSMDWIANFQTPTSPAFGTGTIELVQIATPEQPETTNTTPPQTEPGPHDGVTFMDFGGPYNGHTCLETAQPYADSDNPGQQLTVGGQTDIASASDTSMYIDYIMYLPPGSDTQWVPLATFKWSTNGSAILPKTGQWSDYVKQNGSDSAGTISPGTKTLFTLGNTFPSWTQAF